jgi:polyisoprenoid-binding protein YceI
MLLVVLALGAQAETASPAHAQVFRVDPSASRVSVHVGKAGLFSFAGHEHDVLAATFKGDVVADPDHLAGSSVHLVFESTGLRLTDAGDAAADVPKVEAAMRGPGVLDVARFPEIRFDSRAVSGKRGADGVWGIEVTGDLRLRAAARPLVLSLRVEIAGDTLTATGKATLKQTDFGIEPVSVGGVVKVKNDLAIEYTIVARAER